jgi:hypothetical protein
LGVTILGQIFEQSISDLEKIKEKAEEKNDADVEVVGNVGKRKKDGIFYTPDYIVDYIVHNSLGTYLREKEEELKSEHNLKEDILDKNYEKREQKAYEKYQSFLENIKILDPACGSGAFLVKVFDYLLAEHKRVGSILQGKLLDNEEVYKSILQNNIFGVDLNEESVQITKLSLWLKTAEKNEQLTSLNENIKCGNSLISDKEVVGESAFDWQEEFSEIMQDGGFDVVVGNPPYVDSEEMVKSMPKIRETISENYTSASGNWDLFIPFIEKGLILTKESGYLGYINPNKILSSDYASSIRKFITKNHKVSEIVYVAQDKIFKDADVYPVINVFQNSGKGQATFRQSMRAESVFMPAQNIGYENWSPFLHKNSWLLSSVDSEKNLDEIVDTFSSATVSEAYELKEIISDSGTHKIINTGTIDKYISLWGIKAMRYIKDDYLYPKTKIESYLSKKEWVDDKKIIVAGMSKEIEAFCDDEGSYIAGKSTVVITADDEDNLFFALGILNSKIASSLFEIYNFSQGMAGGYMNINQNNLGELPIPHFSKKDRKRIAKISKEIVILQNKISDIKVKFKKITLSKFNDIYWSNKLNYFEDLDFSDFIKYSRLSLNNKKTENLLDLFEDYSNRINNEKKKIDDKDKNINHELYGLYNLDENLIDKIT